MPSQFRRPGGDLDNLWRKIDAGADRAISQFFFSPECFCGFRDSGGGDGHRAEIVPGILPVSNVAQTRKFAASCGAAIPRWMDDLFEGLDNLPGARQLVAATGGRRAVRPALCGGIRHFHFYTLNRAELAYAICHLLGLRPQPNQQEQAA
jgi:methylenetetrahydrofolate reductase (NADPH)